MKWIINKLIAQSVLIIIALAWFVFILNFITPFFDLNAYGIRPRSVMGLIGVISSPFLHGGVFHILANTIGLLICGFILKWSYSNVQIWTVIVFGIFVSGFLTWLISSSGVVIGASGLVYCFIGVLLGNAFFNPKLMTWAQAISCLFFYSGAILSLLSVQKGISWAGHFSGLVTGCFLSYLIAKRQKQ